MTEMINIPIVAVMESNGPVTYTVKIPAPVAMIGQGIWIVGVGLFHVSVGVGEIGIMLVYAGALMSEPYVKAAAKSVAGAMVAGTKYVVDGVFVGACRAGNALNEKVKTLEDARVIRSGYFNNTQETLQYGDNGAVSYTHLTLPTTPYV